MKALVTHIGMPILTLGLAYFLLNTIPEEPDRPEGAFTFITFLWLVVIVVILVGGYSLINGVFAVFFGSQEMNFAGRRHHSAYVCPYCMQQFGGKQYRQGVNHGHVICHNCGQRSEFEEHSWLGWFTKNIY